MRQSMLDIAQLRLMDSGSTRRLIIGSGRVEKWGLTTSCASMSGCWPDTVPSDRKAQWSAIRNPLPKGPPIMVEQPEGMRSAPVARDPFRA